MIQATFIRQENWLKSAELTGHAGSGEYGFDVVCAAVSALSLNFINSLEALTDCKPDLELNDRDGGYMRIDISQAANAKDENVQLLFESFFLGMTNLAENSSDFLSVQVITN